MSGLAEEDEREPLLIKKQNGSYHSTEEQEPAATNTTNADDVAAQIEAIKENLSSRSVAISFASISACLFVFAVDGSLFVTILNDVSTAFSASDLSFWIGTSYMLSSCIAAPIYGRLNDVFGRKNALVCGVSLFLLGTALCSVAPTMLTFIAARSLAGVGGGGVTTCFAIVLGDLIPLRKRGIFQAWSQLVFSLGGVSGGPIGGLLNDLLGWRMTIGCQVPVLALALFLLIFVLHLPEFPKTTQQQERESKESELTVIQILQKRLDFTGIFLLAATCLLLMIGLSFISAGDLPLSDIRVWSNFAISAALLVMLIWYEAYIANEPIIPLALFKNGMIASVVSYYFTSSVAIGCFFYFPIYFRSVLLQSSSQTGLHFISLTVSTTLGSTLSGALLTYGKVGRYKKLMIFCSTLFLITPVVLSTWSNINVPSRFVQNFILAPFGFAGAAMSTIMVMLVLASCPRESQATALGLVYLSRSLGSIVGVSMFGAQIQYVLKAQLTKYITGRHATKIIDNIRKNANSVASLPDDIRPIAFRAYASAYRILNISTIVVVFVSFLIVLTIKEVPLNGAKKSDPASSSPEETEVETNAREPSVEEEQATSH
jgi:MFS family permease